MKIVEFYDKNLPFKRIFEFYEKFWLLWKFLTFVKKIDFYDSFWLLWNFLTFMNILDFYETFGFLWKFWLLWKCLTFMKIFDFYEIFWPSWKLVFSWIALPHGHQFNLSGQPLTGSNQVTLTQSHAVTTSARPRYIPLPCHHVSAVTCSSGRAFSGWPWHLGTLSFARPFTLWRTFPVAIATGYSASGHSVCMSSLSLVSRHSHLHGQRLILSASHWKISDPLF